MNFHKTYAKPEKIEALLKEKNSSSWNKLFGELINIRHGSLSLRKFLPYWPGLQKTPPQARGLSWNEILITGRLIRKGNQLPYID